MPVQNLQYDSAGIVLTTTDLLNFGDITLLAGQVTTPYIYSGTDSGLTLESYASTVFLLENDGAYFQLYFGASSSVTVSPDSFQLADNQALFFSGTGANASLNNLLPSQTGNANKALVTNGSNTSWQTVLTGTVGPTQGGTGITSYTTGDTLYASAANTLSKLAIGATSRFLTVSGGIPAWSSQSLILGGTLTTAAAFTTSGAFALTLTQTGATNVTLPTTGTLATLAGSETLSNKTLAAQIGTGVTRLVLSGSAMSSPYTLSVQDNTAATWIEILNNGGAGKGCFFGLNGNNFELWNYQAGSISFLTGTVASSATSRMMITNAGQVQILGDFALTKTITSAGTTGAQTINKNSGSVNFAAAATSLVVTNSLVSTSSVIIATVGTNDTTMKSVQAVAGSGSFTLYPNAAPTAETKVFFIVTN